MLYYLGSTMDSLCDLAAVLRTLHSEKATERKRGVQQLKNLLSRLSVTQALTEYSEEKQKKKCLTWDSVLKAVIKHVNIESDALQRAKETTSASSLSVRERKKKEISATFKFVVRTAEKSGARLKITSVLNHIMGIMKEKFTCSAFGADYSNVLLKNILGVRRHWLEIPPKTWHDLLVLYCQFFLDSDCVMDRTVVARLLHVLMTGAALQCDLQPKKLLIFFTEVFRKIRELNITTLLEYICGALNIFMSAIAPNARTQVCKLGETILPGILHLWNNFPSDSLKEDLLKFLQIQIQTHHPAGARTPESGAFAVKWDVWKGHLNKIYELIYNELDQLGGRHKFSTGSRNVIMKDSYIELAADVCHQLYTGDSSCTEVIQQLGAILADKGTPAKKRRLMSGWSALLDTITTTANTPNIMPWLQLLAFVLDKYPCSLLEMDGVAVLECLHQVLTTCKGSDTFKLIFSCLRSLARSADAVKSRLESSIMNRMKPVWLQTWTLCLSIISSKQAEADGYQQSGFDLLTTLLQCDLVQPGRQVWNLFLPDVVHPTFSSISFLAILLSTTHIPENYQPSILGSSFATKKGMFPLRKHLLAWIMQQLTQPDTGASLSTLASIHTLVAVVIQLMVRDPGAELLTTVRSLSAKCFTRPLEELYLLTTFDCTLDFEIQAGDSVAVTKHSASHLIPVMVIAVNNTWQEVMQRHLLFTEPQVKNLELLAYDCCILSHFLLESKRLDISVLTAQELLLQLLDKLTALLDNYLKGEGTTGLLPVLDCLLKMATFPGPSDLACFQTAETVRGCIPAKLLDLLCRRLLRGASSGRGHTQRTSTQRESMALPSVHPSGSRRAFDSSQAFETLLGGMDNASGDEDEISMDIGFDEDDVGDSQDRDEVQHLGAGFTSQLDPALLSESQALRNSIVHFLCLLIGHDFRHAPKGITNAGFSGQTVKMQIEDLLSEEKFNPNHPADLQMMDLIIRTLLSPGHHVTDRDLENIMDVLRRVAPVQRFDQQVCDMILSLLVCVVPHLSDPDELPSRIVKECRGVLLHLISAFWILQSEGNYNSSVRLRLAECMAVITQHDPQGTWGKLKLKEKEADAPTVPDKLPYCLIDGSLPVRVFVSTTVKRLFVLEVKGQFIPQERKQQHAAFDLLYEICSDMMDVQGRLSEERQQDERWNRTASLLLTLSCAAMASHVCEKKALFALCQSIHEKKVDVTLVCKVLAKMAKALHYAGVEDYLICHLPFLVSQWLDLRCPLTNFPIQLLGCTQIGQFYRNHHKLLVSQQFIRENMAAVGEIAATLNQEVKETLKGCLPELLVHILPVFAISKSQKLTGDSSLLRLLSTATACYDELVQQLGQDTIDKNIVSQLGRIVVQIFSCLTLQETETTDNSEGGRNPESNPPSYSRDIIHMTLNYLTSSLSRSLVTVLGKTPDGIEQVLLELWLMLRREHRAHEQLRVLQMLQVFVSILLQELVDTKLGGAWAFVLRRVVTTFLHTLTSHRGAVCRWQDFSYPKQITLVSLHLLKKVCAAMIECCHQELGNYLCHIVDVASQLAVESGEVGGKAMELLKFLLLDNADQLHGLISSLDPLPDHPAFAELTNLCERVKWKAGKHSLEMIIDQVLRMARDVPEAPHSFSRTLTCLVHAIHDDKVSFNHLLANADGVCKASHLICALFRLIQSSSKAVVKEAGRCLGAIGPINLKTFSLPGPQLPSGLYEALQVYRGGPAEKYCHIFHSLHHYLVDKSVDVVEMASMTLKKLLATPAGAQFSADYRDKLTNRDNLFQYLHPFHSSKQTKTPPRSCGELQQFHELVNVPSLWVAENAEHGQWVKDVCVALLKSDAVSDAVLSLLQPVCEAKVEFCEMLLPYLIHDILSAEQAEHREVLSQRLSAFFSSSSPSSGSADNWPKSVHICKESVLIMLKVINYLRTQDRPSQSQQRGTTAWDNNFWLDLNFLNVAMAAQNCGAHFSAVLFTEIWCDQQRETGHQSQHSCHSSESLSQESLLHSLTSLDSSGEHSTAQALLLEALRCTGDPDAIYGCGAGCLPDAASRVETYLHEKHWEKAVVTLDIQMQQPAPALQLGLLSAVQRCGLDYLLHTSLEGLEQSIPSSLPQDLAELQYQAAWRAGQWDCDIPQRLDRSAPLHHSLYSCLHAVRDEQPGMALSILNDARCFLLLSFDVHLESCYRLYPLLAKLQCLHQFEIFITALTSDNREEVRQLFGEWQQVDEVVTHRTEFEFLELVQSLRLAIVRLLASCEGQQNVRQVLQSMLLMVARTARKAGYFQLAERHLHELQLQVDASPAGNLGAQLESAQLFWSRSEHTTAKHILKSLITKCEQASGEDEEAKHLLPTALGLYGNWLAETRSETPSIIMKQFLERTVQLLESKGEDSGQEAVESYLSLARFSDIQYQNIVNYMRSPTFEAKQALMKKAAAEYEKFKDVGQPQKDRYLRTLEKQTKIDQEEVAAMVEDRERFLRHAVRCYTKCLQHGDAHDLRIFRLMSLWFDNSSVQDISDIMQDCSEKLKSYKFLPLLHQLAARLSSRVKDNQKFFSTLNRILERAALDHPHHTLWVVLALAHANKDEEIQAQGRGGRLATGKQGAVDGEDRVQAAHDLLECLKVNSKVAPVVRDMEVLSTAYVQLANWSAEQFRRETKPVALPKSLDLMALKELCHVCVPSLEVPVDASGHYDNIVYIRGFQPTFRLAGGVNLPKIITYRCSDGVDRRQLVKGRDDLRQDAIMQQVFALVNRLLLSDTEASHRQLHIRTYKVVPLSRCSGLLEWCEGTQPIGEYLVGSPGVKGSGAHARYQPKDWSYLDCRKYMMSVPNAADTEKKYSVYMEACKNFQPVFRFFFMEKFLDPAVWFQRRLAYTHSVATNSIVGYILGLGDRHVMNILIDCNSAELIHIDLGVAFEQGHILPTPETVPFRLTRDIVDGMGVTGVEGVFRRCCEKTMEVMRAHQESLMTIVQVLLYDPLSEWTLSPQKVYALQACRDRRDCDTADLSVTMTSAQTELDTDREKSDRSLEPVNKLAERVLLRLQQKLQGLEDGVTLSVAGQVNHLIQTARDPHNLCRLFPGWQPYI